MMAVMVVEIGSCRRLQASNTFSKMPRLEIAMPFLAGQYLHPKYNEPLFLCDGDEFYTCI